MLEGTESGEGIQETQRDPVASEPDKTPETVEKPIETAREATERAFKDLQRAGTEGEDSPSEPDTDVVQDNEAETKEEAPKVEPKPGKDEPIPEEFDPELSPPERLKAHERALFNNLPKGLKRAFHRTLKETEGNFTRERQEVTQKAREYAAIDEIAKPHLTEWAKSGYTKTEVFAELLDTQQKLTNPETKLQRFIQLADDCKIDLEHALKVKRGEIAGPTQKNSSPAPETTALQSEVERLRFEQDQLQQRLVVEPVAAQMRSVQHEKDPASGRYLYPELHDEFFIESLKPLVSERVRTVPNTSYADALKWSVLQRRKQIYGDSFSPTTRFQPSQTNNQQERALSAAFSVRGRSATPSPVTGDDLSHADLANLSTRELTERALKNVRQGRQVR